MKANKLRDIYNLVMDASFCIIIFVLLIALIIGIFKMILEISLVVTEPNVRLGLKDLITSVLSLIIVLELVRAFVDYFEHERVRLEVLVEVVIAFFLREMLLYTFEGKIKKFDIIIWAGAILVLIIGRTLAVTYSPEKFRKIPKNRS